MPGCPVHCGVCYRGTVRLHRPDGDNQYPGVQYIVVSVTGALFASIALMETISTLVSSTMFNAVYAATVAHVRGAVFFVMAGIISLDCLLVL